MQHQTNIFKKQIHILCVVICIIVMISGFYDLQLLIVSGVIGLLGILVVLLKYHHSAKNLQKFMEEVAEGISAWQENALVNVPVSVVVTDDKGEILWQNQQFTDSIGQEKMLYGTSIFALFGIEDFLPEETKNITVDEKRYTVFTVESKREEVNLHAYYLLEDTELKNTADEYTATRPAVMMMTVDSYDEALQDYKENERSQLLSQVEYHIEKFVGEAGGMVVKTDRDRYIAILEHRHMEAILTKRFDILDKVRSLAGQERMPLTLSIGVGKDRKSYAECELAARQSLDMALGRGGDQAAVKTANGYDFYGGVSKGIEKSTKVKTRIVATALQELMESSSNIILMGHKFADLDALGSAVGLLRVARQMNKKAFIAIDRQKNLVMPLLTKLEQNGYEGAFRNPEDLMDTVDSKTLLIVVDTHLVHVLESAPLYRKCHNVVVIDHHRRMVGYIENAVIFYHEPYASSASEMVAELVQYLDETNRLGRVEAEALLAGIMLDTKNFIIRTGVRTFEAAAFLRKQGADTIEVRKLFNSTMESYQQRTRLVSSAEIYKRCAIAFNDTNVEDIKIIAPQAADELLSISEVDASFVLYEAGKGVNISGRSMGKMNVQVIMETLGGGGHQTMAATQMENISIADARQQLLEAIDQYYVKM